MIERQVIVTWSTMSEGHPADCENVPVTISGKSRCVEYDHALVMAEWSEVDEFWDFNDAELTSAWEQGKITVHAWADLEPYGGDGE